MQLKLMRRSIPKLQVEIAQKVVAVESAKFHNKNFRKQAWGNKKWKKRKDGDTSRALLKKTSRLKRAATTPIKSGPVTSYIIPIYGKVHNNGERAGRGKGFKMPKRKFIGLSHILQNRLKRKSIQIINQRLNHK